MPMGRATINGRPAEMESATSVGWCATGMPHHEQWNFLMAPLAEGENTVSLEQFVGSDCTRVFGMGLGNKAKRQQHVSECLAPTGVDFAGQSVALIPTTEVAGLASQPIRMERPVDRITGVFLDTIEPLSVRQGWGTLQKNRSVWEKPMTIAGRRFLRGLGTHAPSKIVFALDGKYRRFQAWAGADANTSPTVTFEVWVDGVKKWQTGLMTRETPAAWVDVDVSAAKRLELVVGDAGDATSDHADWAEARVLR